MQRVLALTRYGRLGPSSRLRTYQYQPALRKYGIDMHIAPLFPDCYVEAIYADRSGIASALAGFARRIAALRSGGRFDAIWLEKEALPWLPAFIERALLPRNIPLIVDYDDAVFHRYDMHGSSAVRRLLGGKIKAVMRRADIVVAGNTYLAEWAHSAGARRVEIVPTVVDISRYVPSPRHTNGLPTIGWIGSPKTVPYLDLVHPIIGDLQSRMNLRAVAIGARPDQVNDTPFEAQPWSEASEVSRLREIDIGIMPLRDSPWESGKCGYKLIQYMALAIPVIASPVGANREIIAHGRNGLLAKSPQEWKKGILTLLQNRSLRISLGLTARNTVVTNYSLQITSARLAELLSSETVKVKV